MDVSLLYAFAGGLFLIILGLGYKHASVVKSAASSYGSVFTGIAFLITLGYSFLENSAWADPRLWAMGLAGGALFSSSFCFLTLANQAGPPSISWPVINLASIVSIVMSVVFLNERLVLVDALILGIFAGMILVLNEGMKEEKHKKASWFFWPLVFGAFALNGVFLFMMKIKEASFPTGNNGAIMAVCFGSSTTVLALYRMFSCRRRNKKAADGEPKRYEIPWRSHDIAAGAMAGFGAGFGNIFLLKAMSLPAVVVLPISQGLTLIGGIIAMTLIYRERFNRAKVTGLFIVAALLLLTVFREKGSADYLVSAVLR